MFGVTDHDCERIILRNTYEIGRSRAVGRLICYQTQAMDELQTARVPFPALSLTFIFQEKRFHALQVFVPDHPLREQWEARVSQSQVPSGGIGRYWEEKCRGFQPLGIAAGRHNENMRNNKLEHRSCAPVQAARVQHDIIRCRVTV